MTNPLFAQTAADLPQRDTVLSMSGLDFMRAQLNSQLPAAPIAQTLGFQLDSVEDGCVSFKGAPGFAHMNPVGAIHGGWYGAILDSAMGCAVMTKVPQGSLYTTLEFKVNIIRPIAVDTQVICTAITDHAGRSTGIAAARIRDAQTGKLYATGSTTCIIMTP